MTFEIDMATITVVVCRTLCYYKPTHQNVFLQTLNKVFQVHKITNNNVKMQNNIVCKL